MRQSIRGAAAAALAVCASALLLAGPAVRETCAVDLAALAQNRLHASSAATICATKVSTRVTAWGDASFGDAVRTAVWLFTHVLRPVAADLSVQLGEGGALLYTSAAEMAVSTADVCVPVAVRAAVMVTQARPLDSLRALASDATDLLTTISEFLSGLSAVPGAVADCVLLDDACKLAEPSFDASAQPRALVWMHQTSLKLGAWVDFLQVSCERPEGRWRCNDHELS